MTLIWIMSYIFHFSTHVLYFRSNSNSFKNITYLKWRNSGINSWRKNHWGIIRERWTKGSSDCISVACSFWKSIRILIPESAFSSKVHPRWFHSSFCRQLCIWGCLCSNRRNREYVSQLLLEWKWSWKLIRYKSFCWKRRWIS